MAEQNEVAIEGVVEEAGAQPTPFSFSLKADETGVTELTFVKNAPPLFSTIFFALDYINSTFDTPYPSLGDFLRQLAESADQIDALATGANQEVEGDGNEIPAQG